MAESDVLFSPALLPYPILNEYIFLHMNGEGKIIRMDSDRNAARYASIGEQVCAAGNIRDFFDIRPHKNLNNIPELNNSRYVSFENNKNFKRLEDPVKFYTNLPTARVYIQREGDDLFSAIIRPIDTVPGLSVESSSSIIYINQRNELLGFNQAFFELFREANANPYSLLGNQISEFFNPTPDEFQNKQTALSAVPSPASFKRLCDIRFSGEPDLQGIECSNPAAAGFTDEGLVCGNQTDDVLFLKLPFVLDSRADFILEVESETLKGDSPLFFLGREFDIRHFSEGYPDVEGYQIGPFPYLKRYILKRRATLQHAEAATSPNRKSLFSFCKIKSTLWLLEDQQRKLAYCDFDFLHYKKATLTLGIRIGSVCRISRIRLFTSRGQAETADAPLPVVRFKTPLPAYAILNRISSQYLSMRYPDITIFFLENITRIQKQLNALETENKRLLMEMEKSTDDFIGKSQSVLAIKRNANIVANSDTTLLIQGETGTGKEMLARYIHGKSKRKKGPFVKVDCSTLSKTLMESELFGHEKGAFTGATEKTTGSFERAEGGTLFLDEVGNLSLETQAKLLHFMQDHTITRVGGDRPIRIDVRIIVATNTSLQELVEQKLFRSDLFFRMDVISITLPPLRDRKDDIVDFCRHFLDHYNAVHKKSIKELSPAAYQKIFQYAWPGNVRELKNALERAVIFCDSEIIGEDLITFSLDKAAAPKKKRSPYQFQEIDLDEVRRLLKKHRGNVQQVISELNVPRRTFYEKIRQLGATIQGLRKEA